MILNIIYSLILGAAWSLYLYKTKTQEQEWDPCKFARTGIVGIVAGIILYFLGQEPTQQDILPYVGETSALTLFIDALLKKLFWQCRE